MDVYIKEVSQTRQSVGIQTSAFDKNLLAFPTKFFDGEASFTFSTRDLLLRHICPKIGGFLETG